MPLSLQTLPEERYPKMSPVYMNLSLLSDVQDSGKSGHVRNRPNGNIVCAAMVG